MDDLQPLLSLLGAKYAAIAAYWLAAEKLLKLLQPVILGRFNAAIERAVATEDPEDEALLRRLFSSPAYRTLAFVADLLIRLKLPGNTELNAALQRAKHA